nr:ABC transporter substrate-binding protein [uncultured Marvinbryantia sp.]
MKKRNQLLTLIMAGVMALSPAAAFAEETEAETQEAAVETEAAETEADGAEAADGDVFPFTLVTKDDQEVTFTHVPERVISTNPNTGEQLMALGLGDKIIGTCYNNAQLPEQYREEYESKPVISDNNGYPSLEVVLDLEPDFIYGRSSAFSDSDTAIATHDALSEYGIMSLSSIEGYKLGCDVEDVYQDFYNLGKIFQVEDKANEIVDGMKAQIAAVEEKIAGTEEVRVFNFGCEMDGGAYTPGNNFTSKLMRHAGGVNVFEDLEKTWNTVSWEAVVEADPEVIVINDYGDTTADEKIQFLLDNEALSDVTAIKNENFLVITLPEVFASTRVGDTIEKFAQAFHPECFE